MSSILMTPVLVRSYNIFSSDFPHFFTFGSGGIGGGEVAELRFMVVRCGCVVVLEWLVFFLLGAEYTL